MTFLHSYHVDTPSARVESTYSSSLTSTSDTYSRKQEACAYYFYEALKIGVTTGGHYSIRSNSSVDMYGYIYNGTFEASEVSRNLMAQDDDRCGKNQFGMQLFLLSNTAYILVATTANAGVTGSFTIIVSGPASVHMNRTSECLECTANATWKHSLERNSA